MRVLLFCLLLGGCFSCGSSSSDQTAATAPAPAVAPDTATLASPAVSVDSAYQIVPGERIGQVLVGESPEKVINALGEPDAQNAAMGKAIATWYSSANGGGRHELNVYTVRENTGMPDQAVKVHQVRVTSPAFQTFPGRLGAGSSLSQIKKVFPEVEAVAYYQGQNQQRVYLYDAPAQGITFEIAGADSSAVAVTVHRPGVKVTDTYLPVHPDLVRLGEAAPQ